MKCMHMISRDRDHPDDSAIPLSQPARSRPVLCYSNYLQSSFKEVRSYHFYLGCIFSKFPSTQICHPPVMDEEAILFTERGRAGRDLAKNLRGGAGRGTPPSPQCGAGRGWGGEHTACNS